MVAALFFCEVSVFENRISVPGIRRRSRVWMPWWTSSRLGRLALDRERDRRERLCGARGDDRAGGDVAIGRRRLPLP